MTELWIFELSREAQRATDIDGAFEFKLPTIGCPSCSRTLDYSPISAPILDDLSELPWSVVGAEANGFAETSCELPTLSKEEFQAESVARRWHEMFPISPLPGMCAGRFLGDLYGAKSEIASDRENLFLTSVCLERLKRAGLPLETIPAEIRADGKGTSLDYAVVFFPPVSLYDPAEYRRNQYLHCQDCGKHWQNWRGNSVGPSDMLLDRGKWDLRHHAVRMLEFPSAIVVDDVFREVVSGLFPGLVRFTKALY